MFFIKKLFLFFLIKSYLVDNKIHCKKLSDIIINAKKLQLGILNSHNYTREVYLNPPTISPTGAILTAHPNL
jgi:hypothetical protein